MSAGALGWHHRDPFDRMLAATSMIESMPLVTANAAFHDLNGIRLIW